MKRISAWILTFVFVLMMFVPYANCQKAYADALSLSMISGAAYSMAASYGISFNFTDGTAVGAKSYFERKVDSYLAGRSISEVFGDAMVQVVGGKLIIPGTLFTAIANFLQDFVESEGLSYDNEMEISKGQFENMEYGTRIDNEPSNAIYLTFYPTEPLVTKGGFWKYVNGVEVSKSTSGFSASSSNPYTIPYIIIEQITQNTVNYRVYVKKNSGLESYGGSVPLSYFDSPTIDNQISGQLEADYGFPTILNPDADYWQGDLGCPPDTNLEQLIDTVFEDVADNNLEIDSEIIEPGPAPTPVPTFEPYPPVDNVLDGINTGIEIGNDVIINQNNQTDSITDSVDQVNESVESVNESVEAVNESVEAVEEAVEAVSESVETITDIVENITEVPTSEDLPDFRFDLRELFPFCIPFDIYRLLTSFDAEPQAPHVQLPFVIQSIGFSYTLDLDFSQWNPVAQAMRTTELILYALALAWATGKVIKW